MQSGSEHPERQMIVVGAGGHAKVVIELARSIGYDVIGCTDADPTPRQVVAAPVLGTDSVLQEWLDRGVRFAAVGLGANTVRLQIGRRLQAMGFVTPCLLSPAATISPSVRIGAGTVVMAGAVINADTLVGDFAIINTLAGVDHDGTIGDGAHIGPGVALSGSVTVEECALIGVGAAVLPGSRIGRGATLGAGSTAIQNIEAGAVFVGTPAVALKPQEKN